MFNNVVSQQFPVPSMQVGQLEPIANKVDSSGKDFQMGLLESVSNNTVSHQHSISVNHMGLLGPVASTAGSQGLLISTPQMGHIDFPNPGMHQWFLPNKQSGEMEIVMNNVGLQHSAVPKRKEPMEPVSNGPLSQLLAMPNKRIAQMENRPWLQQISPTNRSSVQMQPFLNAPGPKHLPATTKRKVQMVSTSGKHGTSRVGNAKNQNTQAKQSPKVQTESSESVRCKMRESLASALALVSRQDRPQDIENDILEETASSLGKTEPTSQNPELLSAATNVAQGQSCENPIGSLAATDAVDFVSGESREIAASNENSSAKNFAPNANESLTISANENTHYQIEAFNGDKQEFQSSYILSTDDIPFSDNFFVKDEFMQGNGLSWVLDSDMGLGSQRENQTDEEQRAGSQEVGGDRREQVDHSPELLALKIEVELFKLFSGVNKKYKEKGRSLLFNLKDRNNPELRERVMSGDIPPERLCSMTAEELASKELSEWRIAKAEELAQMVVLPNTDVDMRRLVKKTHKGEFQVEVEHDDSVSVEVSGGANSLPQSQSKAKEVPPPAPSEPVGAKSDVSTDSGKRKLEQNQLTQGLTGDDTLKDAEFLPPIVSLDEFMQSLNSESSVGNLPVESGKMTPLSDKDDLGVGSESKSQSDPAGGTPDKLKEIDDDCKKVDSDLKSSDSHHTDVESGIVLSDLKSGDMKPIDGHTNNMKSVNHAEMKTSQTLDVKSGDTNINSRIVVPAGIYKGEQVWEGLLQLNISTTGSVIGIFKSGEKTSAKEWPGSLEIKGRVRLDAFEKFLQELPLSRSRAVMVVHFVSKEGSPDRENSNLREVADSYILDERVGFAEPAPAVELYLCPPHKKTVEMLSKILPKEQSEALNAIDNGLIGIIVWRKTHLTSTMSPTVSSHHKHSSKKQHLSSRRQQDTNVNANFTPKPALSRGFPTVNTGPPSDDDDDVPPGFGPASARDEDDLPEFNFSGGSKPVVSQFAQMSAREPGMSQFHSQTPSRPVDQMRELVYKYGQTGGTVPSGHWQDNRNIGVRVQSWNDDDDDIPEWQPQAPVNQLPSHQALQNYQRRPHVVDESHLVQSHQSMMPIQSLQSQVNIAQGQRSYGTWWVPPEQGNAVQPTNLASLPNGGQLYGTSSQATGQPGIAWQQNVPKSRGF